MHGDVTPSHVRFVGRPHRLRWLLPAYRRTMGRLVNTLFHMDLMSYTDNFAHTRWMGQPLWQNVLDLWTIQETIAELRPTLIVETGTYQGGSAVFYAQLLELTGAEGRVLTVDVLDDHQFEHPGVTFLTGSSVSEEILAQVREAAEEATGPVLVILDSDHAQGHVAAELEAYAPFVSPGSLMLVQDGCIDTLPSSRRLRPGPLPAIREFLPRHPEFELDAERVRRFPITHHPMGWLRRRA